MGSFSSGCTEREAADKWREAIDGHVNMTNKVNWARAYRPVLIWRILFTSEQRWRMSDAPAGLSTVYSAFGAGMEGDGRYDR